MNIIIHRTTETFSLSQLVRSVVQIFTFHNEISQMSVTKDKKRRLQIFSSRQKMQKKLIQ